MGKFRDRRIAKKHQLGKDLSSRDVKYLYKKAIALGYDYDFEEFFEFGDYKGFIPIIEEKSNRSSNSRNTSRMNVEEAYEEMINGLYDSAVKQYRDLKEQEEKDDLYSRYTIDHKQAIQNAASKTKAPDNFDRSQ